MNREEIIANLIEFAARAYKMRTPISLTSAFSPFRE